MCGITAISFSLPWSRQTLRSFCCDNFFFMNHCIGCIWGEIHLFLYLWFLLCLWMGKAWFGLLLCASGTWLGCYTTVGVGKRAFPFVSVLFFGLHWSLCYVFSCSSTPLTYFLAPLWPSYLTLPGKSIIQILVETLGLAPDDVPKLTEQVCDSMLTAYQGISGMTNGTSH